MTSNVPDTTPLQEPLAEFESHLIHEYLAGVGQDLPTLLARGDAASRKLLVDASVYAAGRLAEIESRSDYLRHLHGVA